MNNQYSEQWDREVNQLLDLYTFTNVDSHTGELGNKSIWLANYPYAYGGDNSKIFEYRPSRWTILRIKKRVKQDTLSKADKRDIKLKQLGIK